MINLTINKELKEEVFIMGFTPCKKCSEKIIKGEYTKLSDIFDFEKRNEYNESLKKLVPWSEEDRYNILSEIETFDNFKDADIVKYNIINIKNEILRKYNTIPSIMKIVKKYNV